MSLAPDTTLDDVKVRIREAYSNPNVGKISQVVLKDGPQTFRIATLLEIVNPKTREVHHYRVRDAAKLNSYGAERGHRRASLTMKSCL